MMGIKVSVIIPVYNVEKTLGRCIDSIINQTMKDIEIILVDDGSQDNSGVICDTYASKYNNIYVIHKENEGLGPTRNIGTDVAKGEFIYHCDSDDWVEPTMLEDAYLNAVNNDAQATIFGYRLFTQVGDSLKEYGVVSGHAADYRTKEDIRSFFINNLNNAYFTQSACNRLVKRDFLEKNQIKFKPYRRSQDVAFSLDLFDKLEKLSVMSNTYYNYVIEPGKFKGRNFEEMIDIYLDIYKELRNSVNQWGMLSDYNENVLSLLYISQISNYASFYTIQKSGNQKLDIINKLLSEGRVQSLFNSITTKNLSSRFLRMTHYAITKKRAVLLLLIFKLHQIKQGTKI